ncbi:MAG: ABC transporter ATP-binding protein [Treponemataceae bacterium]|nr:ABC transporter ATP-binding protein [Treponemataceae bacterium]
MDFLTFDNVSFTYPLQGDEIETDESGKPILPSPVFDYFTASLPGGFTSLIGPNASGKSTFMLLAGGRVKPQQGKVLLFGKDIAALDEASRSRLASFIYQNMEFEQDDPVKSLLEQVQTAGTENAGATSAAGQGRAAEQGATRSLALSAQPTLSDVISVFELEKILDRKLNGISKGEMQRVLMAFAVLYGSKSIFMDEPMFAMEDAQKHKAMEYLRDYSMKNGIPIFIAMHELDLSRKYAENVLLFYPNRDIDFGTPEEILTNDSLEKAYGVPVALLRETEALNRKSLNEAAEAVAATNEAIEKAQA